MTKIVDGFQLTPLKDELRIDHIVTVHYFEYSKNYIFEGEKHNFWEFLYVDKGEIIVTADEEQYLLSKGDIIFHKPNEWHNVIANGKVAPNLIVIAFDCNSPAMVFFNNQILRIDDRTKNHFATIISESKKVFSTVLNDPSTKALKKRTNINFASEQLIRIHLELLLIEMIRDADTYMTNAKTTTSIREYDQEKKLSIILSYLEENICSQISLADICRDTLLSKSSLQKILKEGTGLSVMEYFKQLKIERAKLLIREGNHNFTEISSILGYNSIHYFSRTFKQVTGMTLSDYASSVKLYLND